MGCWGRRRRSRGSGCRRQTRSLLCAHRRALSLAAPKAGLRFHQGYMPRRDISSPTSVSNSVSALMTQNLYCISTTTRARVHKHQKPKLRSSGSRSSSRHNINTVKELLSLLLLRKRPSVCGTSMQSSQKPLKVSAHNNLLLLIW
jgi:hypothetical protein